MRRWLLWTVVCRRGRRCANLVVDDFESDGVPPGSILRLGYECGGCGTVYEAVLLVGEDDALVSAGRERLDAVRVAAAELLTDDDCPSCSWCVRRRALRETIAAVDGTPA